MSSWRNAHRHTSQGSDGARERVVCMQPDVLYCWLRRYALELQSAGVPPPRPLFQLAGFKILEANEDEGHVEVWLDVP
ncbi:hypothetical protein K523DRAFT_118641 [Schizophyllum commune Tattone D]|nr:hypothetical protein K523DRAFT_118641 [Schizophyllum commune Tattone D]